jgi:chemotaxis protein CheX
VTIVEKDLILLQHVQILEQAVKMVIPGVADTQLREVDEPGIELEIGIIIGITGSLRGKLVLSGLDTAFQGIGEMMYGMKLDGPMLESFAGELGNMIGGNFSIELSKFNVPIDITAPTILHGNTRISGYRSAMQIRTILMNDSNFEVYLLLDN